MKKTNAYANSLCSKTPQKYASFATQIKTVSNAQKEITAQSAIPIRNGRNQQ